METNTEIKTKKVLIVDDEIDIGLLISDFFNKRGYQALALENGLLGLRLLMRERFDVLITDIKMPRMDGIEFARRVRKIDPDIAIIVITGYGSLETAQQAIKIGVNDYLTKPIDLRELATRVDDGLKNTAQRRRDFTYHRKIEEDIKKDKAALDQAKEQFITLLSHELRTPVTVISEAFNILKDAVDMPTHQELISFDEDQRQQAINAFSEGRRRLISIIEDINYYINLNNNEIKLRKEKVSLQYILNNNNDALARIASNKKCILKKEFIDEEISAMVDPERFLDVIARLIHNGAFHNPQGTQIILKLSFIDNETNAQEQKHHIKIEISDNGQGIDEKILANIFSPFNVADIMHHTRGIGLSLPICRKIIELHGGIIAIDSKKDHGTKVTIMIPKE